jgi:hypothetical protein
MTTPAAGFIFDTFRERATGGVNGHSGSAAPAYGDGEVELPIHQRSDLSGEIEFVVKGAHLIWTR